MKSNKGYSFFLGHPVYIIWWMVDCFEVIFSLWLLWPKFPARNTLLWRQYMRTIWCLCMMLLWVYCSLFPILNIAGSYAYRCHFTIDYREMYVCACIMKVNKCHVNQSYWQKCWRKMILNDKLGWYNYYILHNTTLLYDNNSLLACRTDQAWKFE
jgi:hypothetical protein